MHITVKRSNQSTVKQNTLLQGERIVPPPCFLKPTKVMKRVIFIVTLVTISLFYCDNSSKVQRISNILKVKTDVPGWDSIVIETHEGRDSTKRLLYPAGYPNYRFEIFHLKGKPFESPYGTFWLLRHSSGQYIRDTSYIRVFLDSIHSNNIQIPQWTTLNPYKQ